MKKVIPLLKGRIFEQPWKKASGLLVDFRVYTKVYTPWNYHLKIFPTNHLFHLQRNHLKIFQNVGHTFKPKNATFWNQMPHHLGLSSSRDSRCCGLLAISNDADLYQIGHRSDVPVVFLDPPGGGPWDPSKRMGIKKKLIRKIPWTSTECR